jgi:hypothetical protein
MRWLTSHVAGIEQLVDVGAEQDTVADGVLLHVAVVADVRRFERGERPLVSDRALARVGVENRDAKTALPKGGDRLTSRDRIPTRSADPR